jgi:hypothetical protein
MAVVQGINTSLAERKEGIPESNYNRVKPSEKQITKYLFVENYYHPGLCFSAISRMN